jgi:hypothetical protein
MTQGRIGMRKCGDKEELQTGKRLKKSPDLQTGTFWDRNTVK